MRPWQKSLVVPAAVLGCVTMIAPRAAANDDGVVPIIPRSRATWSRSSSAPAAGIGSRV